MTIEKMIEELKAEIELIYRYNIYLSKDLFSICPNCKKRILESIIECEFCDIENNCSTCQPLRQTLTNKVISLFEELGYPKELVQEDLTNRLNRKSIIAILNGVFTNGPSIPLSFPQTCSFEVTNRCNLKCKHCYIGTPQTPNELDTKSVLKVIKNIAEAGFIAIPLSGGEILLRDDLLTILKEIKSYDMDVILSTNGTLFSAERANELKPYIDDVCISIDSHDEGIHDSFRGVDGAQKMALKGIKNCQDNDIPVRIFTTLTKFNYNRIPEFINFMEKINIKKVIIFDLNLVGKGATIGSTFQITLSELEETINEVNKLKNQTDIDIKMLAPFYFIKDEQYVNKMTLLSGGFCNAGISTLNLSPEGNIQPCSRIRIQLGNALTDDLKEIWNNSPVLKGLRDRTLIKGKCGKCEYKFVCGGCRANAQAFYNDYLMEDPRCNYIVNDYNLIT